MAKTKAGIIKKAFTNPSCPMLGMRLIGITAIEALPKIAKTVNRKFIPSSVGIEKFDWTRPNRKSDIEEIKLIRAPTGNVLERCLLWPSISITAATILAQD